MGEGEDEYDYNFANATTIEEVFIELFKYIKTDTIEINTIPQIRKDWIDTRVSEIDNAKLKKLLVGVTYARSANVSTESVKQTLIELLDYLEGSINNKLNGGISVSTIHSVKQTNNGGIAGLEFQLLGNNLGIISNIGVKYTDGVGEEKTQELKIQSDGKYIVAFSNESCSGCINLEPYYYITGSTIASVTSTDSSDISIANSAYNEFVNRLSAIWNWRGYNEITRDDVIDEIVDIKEFYDDYASLVASTLPGVGEAFDVATLILGEDPFTQEELTKTHTIITIAALLSGAGAGKPARDLWDVTVKDIASDLNLSEKEILKIAEEVAGEYSIKSIDDIATLKGKLSVDSFTKIVKQNAFYAKVLKVTNYDINLIYKTQPDSITNKGLATIFESMENKGFVDNFEPIKLYIDNGKPLILDGHHRFVAAKQLGYSRIPIQYIQKDRIHTITGRTLEEIRTMSFQNGL